MPVWPTRTKPSSPVRSRVFSCSAASFDDFGQRSEQPLRIPSGDLRGRPQTNNDVHRGQSARLTESFPDHPFRPVAVNCQRQHPFTHYEAEPGRFKTAVPRRQPQRPPGDAHRRVPEHVVKLCLAAQPPRASEVASRVHRRTSGGLDRQSLAALGPAGIQDLASVLRRHACSKAVGPLALDHARLIGPFHRWNNLVGAKAPAARRGRDCRSAARRVSTRVWAFTRGDTPWFLHSHKKQTSIVI